jgi:hypothetical protein
VGTVHALCKIVEWNRVSKSPGADGKACETPASHVRIEQIKYIGKESNIIEEVEVGLIHSPQGVYAEYPTQHATPMRRGADKVLQ